MKKAEDVMQYNHIEWTGFTVGENDDEKAVRPD